MKLHYLQHIPLETPGSLLEWAKEAGHTMTRTLFSACEPLPEHAEVDGLIVMGGPMNIYEEEAYPWLRAEKAFIRQTIEQHKPVLGICLGSQLIADAIGGKVTANPEPEIGWWPIEWKADALNHPLFARFPRQATVFHWHFDTFSELPPEARVLASSAACGRQAFVYGDRVVGLQFHLENTPELLKGYVEAARSDWPAGPYIQQPEEMIDQPERVAANQAWMAELAEGLFGRVPASHP
ncbi:type 1 glutamine amidotransferase [Gorillibacterium sp. sgz500922]|uniref:type 1 glutamine amidotransferase n=1 Tax=Gorillibacterium sp. sgz500922 TaxID=3446694 RepID=UPI003F66EC56